jgi:hypothetical protein
MYCVDQVITRLKGIDMCRKRGLVRRKFGAVVCW